MSKLLLPGYYLLKISNIFIHKKKNWNLGSAVITALVSKAEHRRFESLSGSFDVHDVRPDSSFTQPYCLSAYRMGKLKVIEASCWSHYPTHTVNG